MAQILEIQTFGDFDEEVSPTSEYLTIVFSPSSTPLRERWRTNRLSASFIADYFSTFFPGSTATSSLINSSELVDITTYVANELLENAMKFSDMDSGEPVSLTLQMYLDKLVFLTKNAVNHQTAERFLEFIRTFVSIDPVELYMQKLEKNAASPDVTESGLGILTLVNDYTAKIGWEFAPAPNQGQVVTTKVQLPLH